METPETCPACGAEVPRNAVACPECGADENTGWNEETTRYDGLDLPDNEFDHGEFVEKEFGAGDGGKKPKGAWVIAAVVLIILFLAVLLRIL